MILKPYIIIITLLTVLTYIAMLDSKKRSLGKYPIKYSNIACFILFGVGLMFIIIAAYRVIDINSIGGIDAWGYKEKFINSDVSLIESLKLQDYEYGYGILIWLFRCLTSNYSVVQIVIYIIMFTALVSYLRYLTWNKTSFLMLIMLYSMYIDSFNIIRVDFAVFIGLFVYIFLYKGKIKTAFFLSIIATSIHMASLILFPLIGVYILFKKKETISLKKMIFFLILLIMIALIGLSLAGSFISGSRYNAYNYSEKEMATSTYLMIVFISSASIKKYKELKALNPIYDVFVKVLPFGLIVLPLQLYYSIFYRCLLFFLPIIFGLVPGLIEVYGHKTRKNFAFNLFIQCILCFYLIYKVLLFFYLVNGDGIPYVNQLF